MKPLRLIVGLTQRLAWAIEYAGLTPGQFDRRQKWDRGTTRRIINREQPPPAPEQLAEIAGRLGVSACWLITGQPTPEAEADAEDIRRRLRESKSNMPREDREHLLDCIRVM